MLTRGFNSCFGRKFTGERLDQGAFPVVVVVAFAAMDFDGESSAVDVVCGGYFADEDRDGVGASGAHV